VAQGPRVGGLSTGISVFFYGLVGLIFFVAFIVILNSLLMSTMERVQEIGTIRARGAQRGFVLRLFAIEGAAMAVIFGTLGVVLGALTVSGAGASGIKATSEILFFVFGGRALHPILDGGHLAVAFAVIMSVTLLSTLVPAIAASRIPPIAAMQSKE
jgi:ABC-type lipoprotein release transport system permease subunit